MFCLPLGVGLQGEGLAMGGVGGDFVVWDVLAGGGAEQGGEIRAAECGAGGVAAGDFVFGQQRAADGTLWNAQYKAGKVAVYSPGGALLTEHKIPGRHTTCPAFGGADLTTLFCTTARQDVSDDEIATNPAHGQTFALQTDTKGQAEHRVIL